jgi:hypothetical protein
MSEHLSWDDVGVVKIPLHGKHGAGKFALVDGDYDGEYLSGFKWHLTAGGYVTRKATPSDATAANIYLHREVCRPLPGHWIDHINRNKLDNRSINLRSVSPKVSAMNRRQAKRIGGKRRYRGVSRCSLNRFTATFKGTRIGYFDSEIKAARAYDDIAYREYGTDAVLNFSTSVITPNQ